MINTHFQEMYSALHAFICKYQLNFIYSLILND